ncbi:MAG: HprK-related kinase B [Phycisphaerae bacterium]|nr:HprK-related kinase B [Phycisphaerae bacterium]
MPTPGTSFRESAVSNNLTTIAALEKSLLAGQVCGTSLRLKFEDFSIAVRTNSGQLRNELVHYYRPFVQQGEPFTEQRPDDSVSVVDGDAPVVGIPLQDVPLDPGKTRRKEAVADLADGRVVLKVRTGMLFLMGPSSAVAVGPALRNTNQIINFIDSRYLRWRLDRGGVLLHAAGVRGPGGGVVIAGLSNRGKSTLALRLVGAGLDFISNDRVVAQKSSDGLIMYGLPKQPRVNPGTIVTNPILRSLIPESRRNALSELSPDELWRLEDKYDVDIEACFGEGKRVLSSPLRCVVVLSWKRGEGPPRLNRVNLASRSDLLAALMKSVGVMVGGSINPDVRRPRPQAYLAALDGCPAYELGGGADFDWACENVMSLMNTPKTIPGGGQP